MSRYLIPEYEEWLANETSLPMVQLAVQLSTKSELKKVIKNFRKMFIGLYACTDGKYIYPNKKEPEIIQLPKYITNCQDALDYAYKNGVNNFKESMTSIVTTDNNIVGVSVNHIYADGTYLQEALKHCLDNDINVNGIYPYSVYECFKEEFERIEKINQLIPKMGELTTLKLDNNPNKPKHNAPSGSITISFPANSIQCYDQAKQTCKGLHSYLSTALTLSMIALSNSKPNFGLNSAFNMRRLLNLKQFNFNMCDYSVGLNVTAPEITLDHTIDQLNQSYQQCLKNLIKDGQTFNTLIKPNSNPENMTTCILSNMGQTKIYPPINDFWIQLSMKYQQMPHVLHIISFSKIQGNRNDIFLKMCYRQDVYAKEKMQKIMSSAAYVMQKIPSHLKIKDAIQQIRRFNKNCY